MKTAADYDNLDADAKAKIDATVAAAVKKDDESKAAEKTKAGYDSMTDEQKAVFIAQRLEWKKEYYKKCKDEPESDECLFGEKLREKEVDKMVTDGYFAKSKADRDLADTARTAAKAEKVKEIAAAAKKSAATTSTTKLAAGSKCEKKSDGTRPACAEGLCCGKAA